MEEAHIYKREKIHDLTKALTMLWVMPLEVGARGFVDSSVFDLLT